MQKLVLIVLLAIPLPWAKASSRELLTVFPNVASASANPNTENKPTNTKADETYWDKIRRPDVLPVWIGGIGALAASIAAVCTLRSINRQVFEMRLQTRTLFKQAKATTDATETTLRSVKLQEIQLRQWVDIDEWKCSFPRGLIDGMDNTVVISFWISNPTKLLMTLKTVDMTAGNYATFAMSHPNLLPPKNKYQQEMPITIRDEADILRLRRNELVVAMNVDVSFDDAVGRSPKQHFRVILQCGVTRCDVTEDQRTYDYAT